MKTALFIIVVLLTAGCATTRLSTHGISESRVRGWMGEVERKSGQKFEAAKITAHAVRTGLTAWSQHYGRQVGVFADGGCGWTSGSKKSILIRLAEAPDGFLPDGYGVHECAHALRFSQTGHGNLPPEWKSWVLAWHP